MDKQAILEEFRLRAYGGVFEDLTHDEILEQILAAHEGETFKYQEDINHDTKTIFVPPDRYFDLRGETDKQITKRMIEEIIAEDDGENSHMMPVALVLRRLNNKEEQ